MGCRNLNTRISFDRESAKQNIPILDGPYCSLLSSSCIIALLFCFQGIAVAANPAVSVSPLRVQWFPGSYQQARKKAQQQGKMILLDMYAVWCRPYYDQFVFSRANVASYIHRFFVPVRRDGSKGEGRLLRKHFNCVTYPQLLVIDPKSGLEVDRLTRFLKAPLFLRRVEAIRTGKDTLHSLLRLLKQKPGDSVLHFRIGKRLAYRGKASCESHLRFVSKNPSKQFPWLSPKALYILGRIYYRNSKRNYPMAIKVFQEYLKKYPKARRVSRVRKLLWKSFAKLRMMKR